MSVTRRLARNNHQLAPTGGNGFHSGSNIEGGRRKQKEQLQEEQKEQLQEAWLQAGGRIIFHSSFDISHLSFSEFSERHLVERTRTDTNGHERTRTDTNGHEQKNAAK